jgi:hypothetical protein
VGMMGEWKADLQHGRGSREREKRRIGLHPGTSARDEWVIMTSDDKIT